MPRFINAELTNGKTKMWFGFWISYFTLNYFYSYAFVDFEQVILLLMAGHNKPFLGSDHLAKLYFRHTFC